MEFLKFLINLDERQDRLLESTNELEKLEIENVVRFPAIRANTGVIGCATSHLYCLGLAKKNQKHALIFEDDVMFINNYKEIFEQSQKELEEIGDWAIWYLGGNICNTITQVTPHLGRLSHAQSTHALAINLKYIDTILTIIPTFYNIPLDLVYSGTIVQNFPCYISIPMMAIQRPSYSDVENTFADYTSWMEKRFFDQLKPLTIL